MNAAVNSTADEPEEIDGENEIILAEGYRVLPSASLSEMGTPGSKPSKTHEN